VLVIVVGTIPVLAHDARELVAALWDLWGFRVFTYSSFAITLGIPMIRWLIRKTRGYFAKEEQPPKRNFLLGPSPHTGQPAIYAPFGEIGPPDSIGHGYTDREW
jgi:hypothetical protein